LSQQQAATGGRSLSKSIIVGLALGGVFLLSVLIYKELFMVLAAAVAALGAWELSTALRIKGWYVPRVPAVVGATLIMPATFYGGAELQWLVALGIVAALILWRSVHLLWERREAPFQALQHTLRDFAASAFVVIYLPLMTSFTVLLLRRPDGAQWVLTLVVTVAMIDTAGYLVGRKFGKHKLAPGVSPKKTWEGLLASITAGTASAMLFMNFSFGAPWWLGLVLAASLLLSAVFGDLAESLIKRDLGVKDMSSLLPGHGGMMDRLDSILPSALITYLFTLIFFA
jgi:phosphatidate cytidylyltransferase